MSNNIDLSILGLSKKELRKYKRRKAQYEALCEKYNIDTNAEIKEQVDKFIEVSNDIQKQIDKGKKTIDEEYFEEMCSLMKINKSLWNQLISLNVRRGNIKEEALDKMKEKYEEELFYVNTKYQFIQTNDFDNTYCSSDTDLIKMPKDDDVDFANDYTCNVEADKILNKATDLKNAITKQYQKEYNRIKDAVDFITNGDFNPKMFKAVIDFNVYKSGYLKEDSVGKMEAFTDKIKNVYETYTKYHLNMFGDYLQNRGLKIERV